MQAAKLKGEAAASREPVLNHGSWVPASRRFRLFSHHEVAAGVQPLGTAQCAAHAGMRMSRAIPAIY